MVLLHERRATQPRNRSRISSTSRLLIGVLGMISLGLLPAACLQGVKGEAASDCTPKGNARPICGFKNPGTCAAVCVIPNSSPEKLLPATSAWEK